MGVGGVQPHHTGTAANRPCWSCGTLHDRVLRRCARAPHARGIHQPVAASVWCSAVDDLSMVRSFVDVFPNAVLLSGASSNLLLIGTTGTVNEIDPSRLTNALMRAPAVQADLRRLDLGTPRDIVGMFVASATTLTTATRDVRPVTDDRPIQEYGKKSLLDFDEGVPFVHRQCRRRRRMVSRVPCWRQASADCRRTRHLSVCAQSCVHQRHALRLRRRSSPVRRVQSRAAAIWARSFRNHTSSSADPGRCIHREISKGHRPAGRAAIPGGDRCAPRGAHVERGVRAGPRQSRDRARIHRQNGRGDRSIQAGARVRSAEFDDAKRNLAMAMRRQ